MYDKTHYNKKKREEKKKKRMVFPPTVNPYQEAHWGCYALVVCRAQNFKLSQMDISQRNPRKRPSPSSSCLEKLAIQGSMEENFTVIFEPLNPVWLFDPTDCSTPGFPVLHYLPEFAQFHSHWVSNAIQPSHPLLPLSPPALSLSQHQGLFQWVGSVHQIAKV